MLVAFLKVFIADKRHRTLLLYALAQYASRAGVLLATLITVPAAYRYLGKDGFGVWMTISSLVGLLSFADLGLGNGLVNIITGANAKKDLQAMRSATATAYLCMAGVILLLVVLAGFAMRHGLSTLVFRNVPQALLQDCDRAFAVFLCSFLINLPASVVAKLQHGLQRGYFGSMWQGVSSLLTIVLVYGAIKCHAGLPAMVAALYVPQPLASLCNTLVWYRRFPETRPDFHSISPDLARSMFGTGFLFLVLQLAAGFTYQSDSVLLASLIGPQAVAEYSVVQRIFSMLSAVVVMSISGLWPSYGDALARQDYKWVIKTFKRSIGFTAFFGAIACTLLYWKFDFILSAWIHNNIMVSECLVAACALWTFIEILGSACAALLNAAGVFRFQVLVASTMAACAIAGKLYLVPIYGPLGAVIATIVSYSLISGTSQVIFFTKLLTKLRLRSASTPSESL